MSFGIVLQMIMCSYIKNSIKSVFKFAYRDALRSLLQATDNRIRNCRTIKYDRLSIIGGLVAGPAIAVLGVIMDASARKNLEKALSNKAEATKL